jgi:hypothetical protein
MTMIFYASLVMIGTTSSFAMVETVITVILESKFGKINITRFIASLIIFVVGVTCSTFCCFNWGFTLLEIVDHYINVYLVMLLAAAQAVAVSWWQGFKSAVSINAAATWILMIGYFLNIAVHMIYTYQVEERLFGSLFYFIGTMMLLMLFSLLAAKCIKIKEKEYAQAKDWYNGILLAGVLPIAKKMVSKSISKQNRIGRRIFEFYWCICIKFLFPHAMLNLIAQQAKADIQDRPGGFYIGWQVIGLILTGIGLILFVTPFYT